MRVQPHLPRSPLTAMVMESGGPACSCALWACKAANSPAPPEPRIKMSVSTCFMRRFALHPLQDEDDSYEGEADEVEKRLWIHEQETGDDQHPAFRYGGLLEKPALQPACERHDADRGREAHPCDRAPIRVAKRLERAGEQKSRAT